MSNIPSLALNALGQVGHTLSINWPLLALSAVVAALLKLYADPAKVAALLERRRGAGILGATAAAVATPFCSCGTTAVVLGMMASMLPWAPIVAFMVASPLTSPEELFYSAGLFGWPFAITFFGASIILGILGGFLAAFAQKKGWLQNQARMKFKAKVQATEVAGTKPGPRDILKELGVNALRLLAFFLPFAYIGYFLNGIIPHEWVTNLFGRGRSYGVPLAASLGLPL